MGVGDWIGAITAAGALVSGTYFSARGLLSSSRTEKRESDERHDREIATARAEERATCEARMNDLLRDRDDVARERDAERARADALQNLINQWRMRGDA